MSECYRAPPQLAKTPSRTPARRGRAGRRTRRRPGAGPRRAHADEPLDEPPRPRRPTKSGDETEVPEGPPSARREERRRDDAEGGGEEEAEGRRRRRRRRQRRAAGRGGGGARTSPRRLRRWRDGDAATRGTAAFADAALERSSIRRRAGLLRTCSRSWEGLGVGAEKALEHGRTCSRLCAGRASRATEEIDVRVSEREEEGRRRSAGAERSRRSYRAWRGLNIFEDNRYSNVLLYLS